jgi:heme O synthase-like polyprenyltransferase
MVAKYFGVITGFVGTEWLFITVNLLSSWFDFFVERYSFVYSRVGSVSIIV